jgi:hypothetical protein
MVKAPPCSQYSPAHTLMRSKLGLEYCRKARQSISPKMRKAKSKPPPCSQYSPAHSLMRSKLGLEYCRKARQSARNTAGPSKPTGPRKPKPKTTGPSKPKPKTTGPSKLANELNLELVRKLTQDINKRRLNRLGQLLYQKATHEGVYKTKKNVNKNAVNSAKAGLAPKYTINQVRATRKEAIATARKLRKRMGLPTL